MFASGRVSSTRPHAGKAETVRIFEVIWEVSDLTMVHNSTVQLVLLAARLQVDVAGAHWVVDAKNSTSSWVGAQPLTCLCRPQARVSTHALNSIAAP